MRPMCSPAQLRQESEELYAVIDKIMEDAMPKSKTSSSSSRECGDAAAGLKPTQSNSLGRPLGRETKYVTSAWGSSAPPLQRASSTCSTRSSITCQRKRSNSGGT
ncbi:hypothetical protein CRUP_012528 [Coryphaenoides rupestris]|nr:hypothetical protein CRUP_012528 [Coryphaenoides rupestris]